MSQGYRPCHHFLRGRCNYGDKCKFSHDKNAKFVTSAASPRLGGANANGWTPVNRNIGNSIIQSKQLEGDFPASVELSSKTSDGLLQPLKYYTDVHSAKAALRAIVNNNGRRFDSVESAEKLVMVINSVNLANTRWTLDEPDALIATIVKTPEILVLIGQIMSWPNVGPMGKGDDVMSFKSCYMGLIGFLTSSAVLNSLAKDQVDALYTILKHNFSKFTRISSANIKACLDAGTFRDRGQNILGQKVIDMRTGLQVFRPVVFLIAEYICRFDAVVESHPEMPYFIRFLAESYERWAELVLGSNFDDALCGRDPSANRRTIDLTRGEIVKLRAVIEKRGPGGRPAAPSARLAQVDPAIMAMVESEYEGPGKIRAEGPRHDNDRTNIRNIQVPPTSAELLCEHPPYTPANLEQAKHHLPDESAEKLLDIQFRLLRIDSMSTLTAGIQAVVEDLEKATKKNQDSQVHTLIGTGGGIYITPSNNGSDRIMMSIMTQVDFTDFTLDHLNGLVIQATAFVPPGSGRKGTIIDKKNFWEQAKRLQSGTLVAIITHQPGSKATVSVAILTSYTKDFKHLPKGNDRFPKIQFGLSFVDPNEGKRLARTVNQRPKGKVTRVLLESPIMFESVRPFLESLQKVEPMRLPFAEYLTKSDLHGTEVEPPEYSLAPGFQWDLTSMLKPDAEVDESEAFMSPTDPSSVMAARSLLHRFGKLDPSQADAVLDCLTRRIGLIQGPPGTGKTFTCVEILRLLVDNDIGNILLIAFTNHALDHILQAVHEEGVTDKFARLGSRTNNEKVEKFLLGNFERMQKGNKAAYNKELYETSKIMDEAQERMDALREHLGTRKPDLDSLMAYLKRTYPAIMQSLENPPAYQQMLFDHIEGGGWEHVGEKSSSSSASLWLFWQRSSDLEHLRALDNGKTIRKPKIDKLANRFAELDICHTDWAQEELDSTSDMSSVASDDSYTTADSTEAVIGMRLQEKEDVNDVLYDRKAFIRHFRLKQLPRAPKTTRKFRTLLRDEDIWSFSRVERREFVGHIWAELTEHMQGESCEELDQIVKEHDAARKSHNRAKDQRRQCVLKTMKLVGATTTLAAKTIEVLKSFQPKVLVVEEAGQVLEAHILAAMIPSVQHVIAIGDPLQLRPTVNTWELDVDSRRGSVIYRFNVSLMERLANQGLPMSQLLVQRRMRPEVSALIRNTLYEKLQDHAIVQDEEKYPPLRGVAKNVFFFNHHVPEGQGGEDRRSKYNDYEAQMACDLALHFLKQGIYNEAGDIVILCAYSGQLQKCRELLRNKKIAVKVDERDWRALGMLDPEVEEQKEISLDRHIYLRTIDNFQGEEANIVILSTVRNAGDLSEWTSTKPPSIGFMQFNNRINVALSRAKHGMYILGNAEQLAMRSEMWKSIVKQLMGRDDIGPELPIVCHRHPETVSYVSKPGEIAQVSPDGGCLRPCDEELSCGHACPLKCHPDQEEHDSVQCRQRCCRLLSSCGHPCDKQCYEKCGPCRIVIEDHQLPCGHTLDVKCGDITSGRPIYCPTQVAKKLPRCEHLAVVACSDDVSRLTCLNPCGKPRDCCGEACTASCSDCQRINLDAMPDAHVISSAGPIARVQHKPHRCESNLPICGHQCGGTCSREHEHQDCKEACLQRCGHKTCDKACSESCAPCGAACEWACKHGQKCRMPCGMPCDRLPCDQPCDEKMSCGHVCPSVCGEPCDDQVCSTCLPDGQKEQVIDDRTKASPYDILRHGFDVRTITLTCGHVFPVGTLDDLIGLDRFYTPASGTETAWKGLQKPDGFQPRPVCPTCRGPITSPRYGRIVKRSLLDIQEQIALRRYANVLQEKLATMGPTDLAKVIEDVPGLLDGLILSEVSVPDGPEVEVKLKIDTIPPVTSKACTDPAMFRHHLTQYFGIDPVLAALWRQINNRLLTSYRDFARMVNGQKAAHVVAYESAIAPVLSVLIDAIKKRRAAKAELTSTAFNETDPTIHANAALIARTRLGSAPPRAEMQYRMTALLETIKIRLMLVPIGIAFERHLAVKANTTLLGQQRHSEVAAAGHFHRLVIELLGSCLRDLKTARENCDAAQLWRSALHVELLEIQARWDSARVQTDLVSVRVNSAVVGRVVIPRVEEALRDAWAGLKGRVEEIVGRAGKEQIKRLALEVLVPVGRIVKEEWRGYVRGLKGGEVVAHMGVGEKLEEAVAITGPYWNAGGTFDQCLNGHAFTAKEGGLSTNGGRCPECGVRVSVA